MITSILSRLIVVSAVWFAATEASARVLGYGVVAVPLVVAASYALTGRPSQSRRAQLTARGAATAVWASAALAGWILARSVTGGVDVARRAVWMPRPDVAPEWLTYETALRTQGARVAFALVMNLMPGSLSSRISGSTLDLHVISPDLGMERSLADVESRIRRIEDAIVE